VKIRVNRDVLADAVAWTARLLPGRSTVPALSGLLLEADADLRISVFDYEVSAWAQIEADVAAPGRVLIPGRVLAEITKSLPDRPVDLYRDGGEAVLTCGSLEYDLLVLPDEDFPSLPAMPPKAGAVGGGVFASAAGQVAAAASRDDSLPMLTGVRIDIDGVRVSMAATDRYRIAAREFLWHPERPDERRGVVVPARLLVEAARSLREGEISIGLGENVIGLRNQDRTVIVRLLDDQFIDYRSRLSEQWPIHADLALAPFVEAVKRVTLVAEPNTPVRLAFSPGQVLIRAGGGSIGRSTEIVAAELDGPDIDIAFQPHFLLDGLAGVETERVRLHMATPTRAALITEEGDDPAFRYLVMPVRPHG